MGGSWNVLLALHPIFPEHNPPAKRQSHSAQPRGQGLLIIPREGGYLVRLYIELDQPRWWAQPAARRAAGPR